MTVNEIRSKYLKFFASKGHTIVESDSLVPKNDPTVLFTTAGMQQFKRQFLGHIDEYTRATTSQKCMRTDDLDEVGVTDFHHTFFEMLGNFSFGDYFKEDAIKWAWEFLTQELQIPADRLWVSVYEEDSEAEAIWRDQIKIDPQKIFKLGGKSNFWPSNAKENGPNGPCGPCSEIFYDYHPEAGTFPDDPDDEMGRFSEVWNLVFTQYNRQDGGVLEPLPGKNIDTGMGLERLAAVLQGKKNNFETDVFAPILKAVDAHVSIDDSQSDRKLRYVIADHLRGICFGIGDGVVPSNEGRGYVIKKLIIDSSDICLRAGTKEPVIYKLVPALVEAMREQYPDMIEKSDDIQQTVKSVEMAYIKVRQERLPEFEAAVKSAQTAQDLGQVIFAYRDTYGLALNTIEKALDDISLDEKLVKSAWSEFETLMKHQQEQSRASSKMTGDVFTGTELQLDLPKTEFLGYRQAESTSSVLKLFIGSDRVNEVKAGDQIKFVLDKTPFYAESGGQQGDIGQVTSDDGLIRVTDTQKIDDVFVHFGVVESGTFRTDSIVKAIINIDRRLSIMRNHTATHLMQSALREILGTHIKQQGSLVAEDRLRFDFSHPKAISPKELQAIEDMVNLFVRACDQVTTEYLSIEEARQSGALAFFAEKYGKTVRVVTIGNYSKEFCGGTHLGSTGQIGVFKIVSESAIAQGIRRIEAKTGTGALDYISTQEKQLSELAKLFKAPVEEVTDKVKAQAKKLKDLERSYEQLQFEALKSVVEGSLNDVHVVDDVVIYKKIIPNTDMAVLRKVSDFLKQKLPSSLIILGASSANGASVLISSSEAAIAKGWKANELIQQAAQKIGGRGGGRPQLAQAGGKQSQKLDEAVDYVYDVLTKG